MCEKKLWTSQCKRGITIRGEHNEHFTNAHVRLLLLCFNLRSFCRWDHICTRLNGKYPMWMWSLVECAVANSYLLCLLLIAVKIKTHYWLTKQNTLGFILLQFVLFQFTRIRCTNSDCLICFNLSYLHVIFAFLQTFNWSTWDSMDTSWCPYCFFFKDVVVIETTIDEINGRLI